MKFYNRLCGSLLAVIAAGSIGCGQTMRPFSHGDSQVISNDVSDSLAKAELAAKEANLAIQEANAIIEQITDENGNINIGLFKKPSGAQAQQAVGALGLLDPITNQLRSVFDKLFAKVMVVKEQFNKARQALNDALAKIDQTNPANAAMVAEIMAQLAKIDQLEAQFSTQMHSLASKLDLAIAGLDGIIKGAITFIPGWGSIIGLAIDFLVMGDIKALILELKTKLMAL